MTHAINISSNTGPYRYNEFRSGGNSPRVNGVLHLRENVFTYYRTECTLAYTYENRVTSPKNSAYPDYSQTAYRDLGVLTLQGAPSPNIGFNEADLINSMKISLRNQIREQDFNLAVAYAEKTQTADLVKSSATKLLNAAKAIKRGKFAHAARHLGLAYRSKGLYEPSRRGSARRQLGKPSIRDTFANNWLQYQYGWRPLYSDMYGSMVATDKAIRGSPDRLKRVSTTRRQTYQSQSNVSLRLNNETIVYTVKKSWVKTYKLASRVAITNPNLHTVDSLGILNPALVVWEKVPFSFVIDWVLPIGDWLQQLPPLLGVSIQSTYLTKVSDETVQADFKSGVFKERSFNMKPPGSPIGAPLSTYRTQTDAAGAPGRKSFVSVSRESSNLSAVLYPERPKMPSSWKQAASALALFNQFMRRR